MKKIDRAIIQTLSYFQIFEYPLRFSEMYYYLHGVTCTRQEMKKSLSDLREIIQEKGYYTFSDKKDSIRLRIHKEKIAHQKIKKAKYIATILGKIPMIQLIGLSGSLSMKNCRRHDDIDLFFITAPGTLWMTRFCVTVLLFCIGEKRSRTGAFSDKVCPNMFLAANQLTLLSKNLYTAHEIAQLKVLYNKNNTYSTFLFHNKWLSHFLPHVPIKPHSQILAKLNTSYFTILDKLFFIVQHAYMKPHMTSERIGKTYALFHPMDKTTWILKSYDISSKKYQKQILKNNRVSSTHIKDLSSVFLARQKTFHQI